MGSITHYDIVRDVHGQPETLDYAAAYGGELVAYTHSPEVGLASARFTSQTAIASRSDYPLGAQPVGGLLSPHVKLRRL